MFRFAHSFLLFSFSFNCTILARLSVGTLGFIKLDTILYRSYFDITMRLWGLDYKLHCGNTLNLIAQNATTGFCLLLFYGFVGLVLVASLDYSLSVLDPVVYWKIHWDDSSIGLRTSRTVLQHDEGLNAAINIYYNQV